MNKTDKIKEIFKKYPQYQETLFTRGYLITSKAIDDLKYYPFYGNWRKAKCGLFNNCSYINIYYHKLQDCHTYEENGITISIIGHAYNPFDMTYQEKEILKDCIKAYQKSEKDFFEKVNELTGIHLIVLNENGTLLVLQDCGGMKSCYYGIIEDELYITSHPQLIGDMFNLEVDFYVNLLMQKWFFHIGGSYLPGDLSPYKKLKRLGPNTFIRYREKFELERFYPVKNHPEIIPKEYKDTICQIAKLINNNIKLCTLKWNTPAISLSGGMDSRTTLACANGLYDKYKYYSFHCKPQEIEDAKVAHKICSKIGLEHSIYAIPDTNDAIKDFKVLRRIIFHNSSYIGNPPDHEVRKFIYLNRLNDFDVELKSWISEIGRAMLGRKYRVKLPAVLTPRHFSIFQTRYFASPKLLRFSDEHYKDYLQRISLEGPLYNYEHADLFFWEFRFGSWGTNVVTTQDIFNHTVTMPLNNRKIMEMLLWFPHEYRKRDMVNKEIIRVSNEDIDKLDLCVHNTYLKWRRVFIEKVYYYYRTLFYRNKK